MERTKEYQQELYDRQDKGGAVWLIERTDTNQYLSYNLDLSGFTGGRRQRESWELGADWAAISQGYLTEEDATNDSTKYYEGGCSCCGSGSTEIPTKITEHQFVPTTKG